MDNQEMDEASIDLETLQAQIDMSMSFAQEMVSSWVKPSRKLPSKSSRDIEAELKEYMHRPPRLGVGAAIPEAHASSRETARLRGQLLGKGNKRSREDERETKEKSEDEEESRAGIIKKKARVDPFGGNDGKKKKKKSKMAPESSAVAPNPLALPETETEEQEEVISMVTENLGEPSTPTATAKRKKRKKKLSTLEPSMDAAVATESAPAPMSPPGTNVPDDSLKSSQEITAGPLNTPKELKVVDVPLTSTPATPLHARRQAQSAALLQQPLLNLAPPGSDDESDEDAKVDTLGASPKQKKKRKRRKKKKHAENGLKLETQTEHVADVA
ncbi:hypothetical protein FPV67DRAFT_1714239 [Lyophyllum atratum]|nr:hypothetical protein FPV67DRAFT_1714239 [Lyophyllum atratum]